MSEPLNLYCDESCHLLNDGHEVMTLGALCCPMDRRREISVRLRNMRVKHGYGSFAKLDERPLIA